MKPPTEHDTPRRPPPEVPPVFLRAGSRVPARPLLFALGVVALFVCGLAALFVLTTDESAAVHEAELERLMVAPEASESLPPYFYDVTTRPAALTLTSAPAGAYATLNAENLGPTPLSLDALRPGYYEINLRHPDHEGLDTTLYLASGAHYRLDLDLVPFPDSAEAEEIAPIEGAAPGGIAASPASRGDHVRQHASPSPGGTVDRFARADEETLRRVWHTGSLSVTSAPSGARVLVDGQPRGQTPISLSGLRPGTYEVTVSLRGYETQTRSVQVGAGAVQHVEARLTR